MQIRFSSPAALSSSLAALKRDDPRLFDRVRVLYSQPTVVVIAGLDNRESARVEALVKAYDPAAKTYADVQFATFA